MDLKPGEGVLIHGGTSGVGTIAIQMLRALGHPVFVTAGTEAKREMALSLGALAAFDYADEHLVERVRSVAGREGVHAILDMSAGVDRKYEKDASLSAYATIARGSAAGFPAQRSACRRFRLYDRERVQNTRRDPIQADEDHTIEVTEHRAPR
jgi:NADPH:quinone reductase-like Zn-dependent oxidoreductase